MRVLSAQGKPRPSSTSKMLLPMELDTAMSPSPATQNGLKELTNNLFYVNVCADGMYHTPCRATMRLAIQSGTLVPAARKVMPMMTSGIPSVKLIMVTLAEEESLLTGVHMCDLPDRCCVQDFVPSRP